MIKLSKLIAFVFVCAVASLAFAQATPASPPQDIAALWPMFAVGIANLAGVMIPRLSAEFTFFHSTAGKATLTALGAFVSAVPSAIQAHGLCWAMLAWAALGCVGALTSSMSTTAKSAATALLPFLLLPALFATGCHGYKAPEYAALTGMAGAAGVAAANLPKLCERQESAAVDAAKTKDDAINSAGAQHARCVAVAGVLKTMPDGLQAARDAVHDAPAGADLTATLPWIQLIVRQYCDAVPLLSQLGYQLPSFPGVC